MYIHQCQICHEQSLDCKCGIQNLGCLPKSFKIDSFSCSIPEFIPIPDQVNHPSHYQGKKLKVIEIIDDFELNFNLGNAIKYILRAKKKGNKEKDLMKAIWYLNREIDNGS